MHKRSSISRIKIKIAFFFPIFTRRVPEMKISPTARFVHRYSRRCGWSRVVETHMQPSTNGGPSVTTRRVRPARSARARAAQSPKPTLPTVGSTIHRRDIQPPVASRTAQEMSASNCVVGNEDSARNCCFTVGHRQPDTLSCHKRKELLFDYFQLNLSVDFS